jgi:hypothetical protein
MAADQQRRDPKSLWQDQEPEPDAVTLEHIYELSRRFDRKSRFAPAIMALGLVLAGFLTAQLWIGAHDWLQQVRAILFLAGQLGCYALIYRVAFPSRDPAAPASTHLRRRLQLRLWYQKGGLAIALLPLLPFVLAAGYEVIKDQHRPLWATIAPFVLLAALLAFVSARAAIGARQTRVQLRELDEQLRR